jgi:mannose-6-phosphate isomerase-like protein (cupin superfamily)
MPEKITAQTAETYIWVNDHIGWHLVKPDTLSVIEEIMHPDTAKQKHYHKLAQQFFYILEGTATFQIEEQETTVEPHEGISILPGQQHCIYNQTAKHLRFLIISQPKSHGDRFTD